jgi:MOSC domain-containing protein YiiM
MPGTLIAIFIKRAHTGPMDSASSAILDEKGLVGNADRGGFRAVTLLSNERWDELMKAVKTTMDPQARRANLLLSGIDLENSRGRTLRIGGCRLRIGGETRPCELMEEAAPGLQDAMRTRWGGGAYATVMEGGPLAVGDSVMWDTEASPV